MMKFFLRSMVLLTATYGLGQVSALDSMDAHLNRFKHIFDVTFYELEVKINFENRSIQGSNTIYFQCVENVDTLQIDLYGQYKVDSVFTTGIPIPFWQKANQIFASMPRTCPQGQDQEITVYYHGTPPVAENPPWEGGFVWEQDSLGNSWVATACQGLGASSWWPCKDHLPDKPDSMSIKISIPQDSSHLYAVSNGELEQVLEEDGWLSYYWFVSNPINTYNVSLNIGKFAHFSRNFYRTGLDPLRLDFYVLKGREKKARAHFLQLYEMLECFEELYGPYPFPEDGYGLVEVPYWGMEHQGAIAYGNNYKNNEFGFDFILLHETAHEYWGNSVSCRHFSDLWIHEAFATYTEVLYMEKRSGLDSALVYLDHLKSRIKNSEAVKGGPDTKFQDYETTDLYFKGAAMLHTLRRVVSNDSLWFATLKELASAYEHRQVSGFTILSHFTDAFGEDLIPLFDHYLNELAPPILEFRQQQKGKKVKVEARWVNTAADFKMPVDLARGEETIRIQPTTHLQKFKLSSKYALTPDTSQMYFLYK